MLTPGSSERTVEKGVAMTSLYSSRAGDFFSPASQPNERRTGNEEVRSDWRWDQSEQEYFFHSSLSLSFFLSLPALVRKNMSGLFTGVLKKKYVSHVCSHGRETHTRSEGEDRKKKETKMMIMF